MKGYQNESIRQLDGDATPSHDNDRIEDGTAGSVLGKTIKDELYYKPKIRKLKRARQKLMLSKDSLMKIIKQ